MIMLEQVPSSKYNTQLRSWTSMDEGNPVSQYSGYGVLMSRGNAKYEGNIVNGKKEGYGRLTFADGRVYVGSFPNDRMHGKGKMIGSFGEEYPCTAVNGRVDGHYL